MELDALWRHVVHVARRLDEREYGPPLSGQLSIRDSDDIEALNACITHETDTNIEIEGTQPPLVVGARVKLAIAPRFGLGLIARNLDGVLSAQGYRVTAGCRFLLLDNLIASADPTDKRSPVGRYGLAIALVQHLRAAALYLNVEEQTLIFHAEGRFTVPVAYGESDLTSMSIEAVESIGRLLSDDIHRKQREAILATAIVEMTKPLPEERRFAHLLHHAEDLCARFENGYKLFAAGFSYEKVRDEVEVARVEYASKIHKVFADIQNQLLGIPVATVIVATQMKAASSFGYEFFVNTAVLVGCFVFAALMVLLIRNQHHTLAVVQDEITRQRRQLLKEYAAVAANFSDTFEYLSKRAAAQRLVLWIIDIVVCIGLLISCFVYFKLTPAAWTWVASRMLPMWPL